MFDMKSDWRCCHVILWLRIITIENGAKYPEIRSNRTVSLWQTTNLLPRWARKPRQASWNGVLNFCCFLSVRWWQQHGGLHSQEWQPSSICTVSASGGEGETARPRTREEAAGISLWSESFDANRLTRPHKWTQQCESLSWAEMQSDCGKFYIILRTSYFCFYKFSLSCLIPARSLGQMSVMDASRACC